MLDKVYIIYNCKSDTSLVKRGRSSLIYKDSIIRKLLLTTFARIQDFKGRLTQRMARLVTMIPGLDNGEPAYKSSNSNTGYFGIPIRNFIIGILEHKGIYLFGLNRTPTWMKEGFRCTEKS